MAKATETQKNNASFMPTLPAFDLEPLIAANQRGLKAAAEAQEHMLHRMAKVSDELFRFVDRRLERDRETAKELGACKSPQDAAKVCGKFFETAVKEYSQEMGLLAGIYADQSREALEDAQHQFEESIDTGSASAKTVAK